MKVLLDECVNRRLIREISGHYVKTARQMGWNGIQNGRLLAHAVAEGFGAFVTIDQNLSFQNNIGSFPIAVLVMRVRSNQMEHLRPLVPQLLTALAAPIPGAVTFLGS